MEIIELFFLAILLIFEIIFLSFALFVLSSGFISQAKGAPYVPIPRKYIKSILEFAELKEAGSFYDLGSGDARVLIEAAKNFGIKKAVGYEISPWPYLKSKFLIASKGFKGKVVIFKEDFLKADLKEADNVFLYLYPKAVQRLSSKFKEELPLYSRIIAVSFPINEPDKFNLKLIKTGEIDRFSVFLYEKV